MQYAIYVGHLLFVVLSIIAILRVKPEQSLSSRALILLVVCVSAAEWMFLRASFPAVPFWDFIECYYPAGKAALEQDMTTLRALYERVVQGFVNMPVVVYLFAPFAIFDPQVGAWLYALIGIVAVVASYFLLVRITALGTRERWILAVLFIANGPLLNGLKFGNTSHILMFGLVAALALLKSGKSMTAGAILGVCTVMKPALGLFGVFFLLRRETRALIGFAGAGILIGALSLLLFGWDFNLFWFNTSILQFSRHWFSTFSVQSIPGFLLRLRDDPQILVSWQPVIPTADEAMLARLLMGTLYAVAGAACILGVRSRLRQAAHGSALADQQRDLQYLLVICMAIVGSPLSWSHYYVWLLIPAAFVVSQSPAMPANRVARYLSWSAIACVTPLILWPFSTANPHLMQVYKVTVVSHLLIGGLLWFAVLVWAVARPDGAARHSTPSATPHDSRDVR